MDVVVSHDSVTVTEPDDLHSLAVISDQGEHIVGSALVGVGLSPSGSDSIEGIPHVWLNIAVLRTLAESATSVRGADWGSRWEDMIAFASQHGWVNEGGTHVRAHVYASSAAETE